MFQKKAEADNELDPTLTEPNGMASLISSPYSENNNRRPDGRILKNDDGSSNASLRPLSCELSCLHRADGSALWKSGSTHVMAAVYGPIAPRIPMQEEDQAIVSVLFQTSHNSSSSKASGSSSTSIEGLEQEWENLMTSVLSACIDTKQYARTVVEIVLHVIQDDGSVLAAALHAAVAALMDAGVAMTNLPVATTFLVISDDSDSSSCGGGNDGKDDDRALILLDPSAEEEGNASILVLVTENENSSRLLATHSIVGSGRTTPPKLADEQQHNEDAGRDDAAKIRTCVPLSLPIILKCSQAAAKATPAVVTFWRLAMEQRATRESQTLWSSS